jgi:catechol 2,3-dioxygenase-like lactoylglutathione lyase family enzyme
MTEISQTDAQKPRLVGINHIALEVGDIDQALDFYGKIFDFTLRGKRPGNAFIELGDQFINLWKIRPRTRIAAVISASSSMTVRA